MKPTLFLGESWFTYSVHQKGFDSFATSEYVEGATAFISDLEQRGHTIDYLPAHQIDGQMPNTLEGLQKYGAVIISDVGANTFLLGHSTFTKSETVPNRLTALAEYVAEGGGLLMVGGYMSFSGIDGKARYGDSPLGPVLPVEIRPTDDRVERPQGIKPALRCRHQILEGLPREWPELLGYNQVEAKPDATVLATCADDPLLVVGSHHKGRTVAFTSDLAPHWAPPAFVEWSAYGQLWSNILKWVGGSTEN